MPKKSVSRQLSPINRLLPRLPHPSWHWGLPGGDTKRAQVASADDFWNHLGL